VEVGRTNSRPEIIPKMILQSLSQLRLHTGYGLGKIPVVLAHFFDNFLGQEKLSISQYYAKIT